MFAQTSPFAVVTSLRVRPLLIHEVNIPCCPVKAPTLEYLKGLVALKLYRDRDQGKCRVLRWNKCVATHGFVEYGYLRIPAGLLKM